MPKIFPVLKKTVIEEIVSGSGPNPTDAFSIAFALGETNAKPTDAMAVAFSFPDTVPGQVEAASFRLAFPDLNPALLDALTQLRLTIGDTNLAVTDSPAFTLRNTYNDAVPAQSDSQALRVSGWGDTTVPPTDTRQATATFTGYATTVPTATHWTNPANAQGAPDTAYARLTDSATAAVSGTLVTTAITDAPADLTSWTITKVEVVYYYQTTNFVGLDNLLSFQWRTTVGTWVVAWEELANANFLSAASGGRVIDITNEPTVQPWTWAKINGMDMRAVYTSGTLTNTVTIDVNSFAIRVTATKNPL
jgi:hypothetical protein